MKVNVIMLNTFDAEIAITHLGESRPFKKRLVTIHLTKEQEEALQPRLLGLLNGEDCYEEYGDAWLEVGG